MLKSQPYQDMKRNSRNAACTTVFPRNIKIKILVKKQTQCLKKVSERNQGSLKRWRFQVWAEKQKMNMEHVPWPESKEANQRLGCVKRTQSQLKGFPLIKDGTNWLQGE